VKQERQAPFESWLLQRVLETWQAPLLKAYPEKQEVQAPVES